MNLFSLHEIESKEMISEIQRVNFFYTVESTFLCALQRLINSTLPALQKNILQRTEKVSTKLSVTQLVNKPHTSQFNYSGSRKLSFFQALSSLDRS